jgi:hypothetical protein
MVEPGKSRGIHFDASRWEDSSSTPILMRDAFEPTIDFVRREFGDATIMQAVSFVSGSY